MARRPSIVAMLASCICVCMGLMATAAVTSGPEPHPLKAFSIPPVFAATQGFFGVLGADVGHTL